MSMTAYGSVNACAETSCTAAAGSTTPSPAFDALGGFVRRSVLIVSVALSSLLLAESAIAQTKLAEFTAGPESVSPGDPVRLSARLTEPAPPGGTEVTFDVVLGGGRHLPDFKALVPAGATSVRKDVYLPAAFRSTMDYSFRALANGSWLHAPQNVLIPARDETGWALESFTGPPALVLGGPFRPFSFVINKPAPRGGLIINTTGGYTGEDGAYVSTNGDGNGLYFPEGTRRAIFLANTNTGTSWGRWPATPVGMLAEIGPQQVGRPPTSQLRIDFSHLPPWFALSEGSIKPGGTIRMSVGIGNAPNPEGTTISLASDNPDLSVPATVFIPAGEAGVEFIASAPAQTSTWLARVTATWSGRTTLTDIFIQTPGVPQVTPTPTPTPAPLPATIAPGGFPTISSGPTNKAPSDGTATFTFEAKPTPGEQPFHFECELTRDGISLGRERGEPCTSPITYTGLESGSYQFGVQGVDDFAFRGSQRKRSFKVDTHARPLPAPPVFSAPATTSAGWVVLTGTAERGAIVEVYDSAAPSGSRLDAPFFTAGASAIDGRWRLSVNDLTEGRHQLSARTVNGTGASALTEPQTVIVITGGAVPTPSPTPTPVPTPSGPLEDLSPNRRPVTVAGALPQSTTGVFGGAFAFNGTGRLLVPQFVLPLRHRMGAWIKPDASTASDQTIIGQWKVGATPGDGASIARLVYDGAARRVIYSVIQAGRQPRTSTSASPAGSVAPGEFQLVEGGVRDSNEVVVGINGRLYYNSQYASHISLSDGTTPFSVGDAATGGAPFRGVIDSPWTLAVPAPRGDVYTPEQPVPGPLTMLFLPFDSGPGTPTPTPTPTPTQTPAPTPTPTRTPTPTPTPTPSPSPTATPTPTAGPVWAPPAPAITAPAAYSWSRSATLTLSGTAQLGATVEVFADGTSLGTTTASASGTWTRTVIVPSDGGYLFTATARNLGGTSPSSAIRVIQIDTRAPAPPVITAPAGSAPTTFTLTGTAEAGTTVEVFENGSSRGTVATSNGTWSRTLTGVPSGTRTFTAGATDFAGNRSAVSAGVILRIG